MKATTTIKIFKEDLSWWNACLAKFNKNSSEVFAILRTHCQEKKQAELFKMLPMPSKYVKPLAGVKLPKKYPEK
jgi:hypothetical protein